VTTWVYRKAQSEVYGALDKYFIPFLEPHEKRNFNTRELQEIDPEHNRGMYVVPQILTNKADGFISLCQVLKEYGYEEVNLNLGCPSKTVVSKNKGSGFLAMPDELDDFLEQIFSKVDMKISIKTRIGKLGEDEFDELLEIYNRYPLEELIIHPRIQTDFYKNKPRMDVFEKAIAESPHSLCYNGDLFSKDAVLDFQQKYPQVDKIMLGRGMIITPGLVRAITNPEDPAVTDREKANGQFREFHERLIQGFRERGLDDGNILYRMKELWFYQIHLFPDSERYAKKLKKVRKLSEYNQIVAELLTARDVQSL
jgi:tRNA-dihydrouridine synthase